MIASSDSDSSAVMSSPCLLNDTYSNLKPAFSDRSLGTMKSTFTAPMPPMEGGLAFDCAMKSCSVRAFDLRFTSSSMSSEASSAIGVNVVGCQGVFACSGVVT